MIIAANAARYAELSTPSIILRMLHDASSFGSSSEAQGALSPSLVSLAGGSDHYST
jgi:hypothetical protein